MTTSAELRELTIRQGLGKKRNNAIVAVLSGALPGLVLGYYLSPLLDKVIKPSKPVANFATQIQGMTVHFQNRAVGGSEGWWDFGDGSALEPFTAAQDNVPHKYEKPGVYTAKLTLRNLIGEENERAVSINLDTAAAPAAPLIEVLEVVPTRGDTFAPAIPGLLKGKFPAIPRSAADLTPDARIQAIANTAAFHFATIEQGGSSLIDRDVAAEDGPAEGRIRWPWVRRSR